MGVGAAELSGSKVSSRVADPSGEDDSAFTARGEGDMPGPARFWRTVEGSYGSSDPSKDSRWSSGGVSKRPRCSIDPLPSPVDGVAGCWCAKDWKGSGSVDDSSWKRRRSDCGAGRAVGGARLARSVSSAALLCVPMGHLRTDIAIRRLVID